MGFTKDQRREFESLYFLVQKCDEDMKIAQMVDTMIQLMVDAEEAQRKHIACKNIVPHVDNRGGSKMEIRKVYLKGSKILGVGFSLGRCGPDRAVCFGRKPNTDEDVKDFIGYAASSPHLPNFEATTSRVTALVAAI